MMRRMWDQMRRNCSQPSGRFQSAVMRLLAAPLLVTLTVLVSVTMVIPVFAAAPLSAGMPGSILARTAASCTIEVPDSETRVYDQAGLFSGDQLQQLESRISDQRKAMNMDMVVVTTEDAEGKNSERYADDYYEAGGFGVGADHSGLLILLDMDNRNLWISTEGEMIRYLTDDRIDAMLDDGIVYMQQGDYETAAEVLLTDAYDYYQQGIPSGQRNVADYRRSIRWYEALLALAVAAFCGGTVCLGVKKEYAMKKEQQLASNYNMAYRAEAAFRFHEQNDILKDTRVVQNVIARAAAAGAARGLGGGRGSVSTTHRSGGGRTHGGGGRGF